MFITAFVALAKVIAFVFASIGLLLLGTAINLAIEQYFDAKEIAAKKQAYRDKTFDTFVWSDRREIVVRTVVTAVLLVLFSVAVFGIVY